MKHIPPDSSHYPSELAQTLRQAVESDAIVQPFLADTVMRRIRALESGEEPFLDALWRLFRPIALAAALLIVGLVSYSASASRNYEVAPTTTEVVFGLQPLNVQAVYDSDLDLTVLAAR